MPRPAGRIRRARASRMAVTLRRAISDGDKRGRKFSTSLSTRSRACSRSLASASYRPPPLFPISSVALIQAPDPPASYCRDIVGDGESTGIKRWIVLTGVRKLKSRKNDPGYVSRERASREISNVHLINYPIVKRPGSVRHLTIDTQNGPTARFPFSTSGSERAPIKADSAEFDSSHEYTSEEYCPT